MGLRITNATDYAVRAVIHLACLPDNGQALREEVAKAQHIPTSFMAKILGNLVRSRLLRSSRGVHGGFALARPAAEISLLEIVEAMEGPLSLNVCVTDPPACEFSADCPASPVWVAVQEALREVLGRTSLEDLVSTPRRNGRVSATANNNGINRPCEATK